MSNELLLAIGLAGLGIIVTVIMKTNSLRISQKTKTGNNTMNNNTTGNEVNVNKNDDKKLK